MTIRSWSAASLNGVDGVVRPLYDKLRLLEPTLNGLIDAASAGLGGVIPFNAITDGGASGDGVTDDRPELNTLANTTIPSTGGTIYFPPTDDSYLIGSSMTVPPKTTLNIPQGALLTIPSGVTLTINGPLVAGPWKIFECEDDTATVVFGKGSVPYVLGEWWGAGPTALVPDSSSAFQAAAIAAQGFGGILQLLCSSDSIITSEYYTVRRPVLITGRMTIRGMGRASSQVGIGGFEGSPFTVCVEQAPLTLGSALVGAGSCWEPALDHETTYVGEYVALSDSTACRLDGEAEFDIEAIVRQKGTSAFSGGFIAWCGGKRLSGEPDYVSWSLWARKDNGFAVSLRTREVRSVTSITRVGKICTVTMAAAHGLTAADVGQRTVVAGAVETRYNGIHRIRSVPLGTTFTYRIGEVTVPATPATGTITATVEHVYGVSGGTMTDNVDYHVKGTYDGANIRLYASPINTACVLIGTTACVGVVAQPWHTTAFLGRSVPLWGEQGYDIVFKEGKVDAFRLGDVALQTGGSGSFTTPNVKAAWGTGTQYLQNFNSITNPFLRGQISSGGDEVWHNPRLNAYTPVHNVTIEDVSFSGTTGLYANGMQLGSLKRVGVVATLFGIHLHNNSFSTPKEDLELLVQTTEGICLMQTLASGASINIGGTYTGGAIQHVMANGSEDDTFRIFYNAAPESAMSTLVSRPSGGFFHSRGCNYANETLGSEHDYWEGSLGLNILNALIEGGLIEPAHKPSIMVGPFAKQTIKAHMVLFLNPDADAVVEYTGAQAGEYPIEIDGGGQMNSPETDWITEGEEHRLVRTVSGRRRQGRSTFTDLDATPSVFGNREWAEAYTVATNVTALDDMENGDEVEILATTGNFTLVDGASLQLAGGANLTLTANDIWRGVKSGTVVYEQSRSIN